MTWWQHNLHSCDRWFLMISHLMKTILKTFTLTLEIVAKRSGVQITDYPLGMLLRRSDSEYWRIKIRFSYQSPW
jgi:hypothetical protein